MEEFAPRGAEVVDGMEAYTLVFHREGGGRVTAGPFTGSVDEVTELALSLLPDLPDVIAYSIWSADGLAIAFDKKPDGKTPTDTAQG